MFNFYIDKLTFLRKLRKDSYICELAVILIGTFNDKKDGNFNRFHWT